MGVSGLTGLLQGMIPQKGFCVCYNERAVCVLYDLFRGLNPRPSGPTLELR